MSIAFFRLNQVWDIGPMVVILFTIMAFFLGLMVVIVGVIVMMPH